MARPGRTCQRYYRHRLTPGNDETSSNSPGVRVERNLLFTSILAFMLWAPVIASLTGDHLQQKGIAGSNFVVQQQPATGSDPGAVNLRTRNSAGRGARAKLREASNTKD